MLDALPEICHARVSGSKGALSCSAQSQGNSAHEEDQTLEMLPFLQAASTTQLGRSKTCYAWCRTLQSCPSLRDAGCRLPSTGPSQLKMLAKGLSSCAFFGRRSKGEPEGGGGGGQYDTGHSKAGHSDCFDAFGSDEDAPERICIMPPPGTCFQMLLRIQGAPHAHL